MAVLTNVCCVPDGHKEDSIWHISWSACARFVATCSADKTIKIWGVQEECTKLVLLATLEDAHSRTVRSCEFSPDGELLASASFDGTVIIWECYNKAKTNWEQIASLEGHENEVKSVAWNTHGNYLATCGRDKRVWLWERLNEAEFECVSVLEGHTQDVKFVKWHPTCPNVLYSASYDDTVKVWREYNDDWYCAETLSEHTSTVWGVAPRPTPTSSSSSSSLAAGLGGDNSDAKSSSAASAEGEEGDDYLVSVSADCSMVLWRSAGGLVANTRNQSTISRNAAASGGDDSSDDDLSGFQKCTSVEKLHEYPILSVDWNRHQPLVVSCGQDNEVVVSRVEVKGKESVMSVVCRSEGAHTADVNCVRWSPVVANMLATVGDDGMIKLWKFGTE